MSQVCEDRRNIRWPTAERFAPEVIERLLATPWAPDVLMNVNFPDLDPDEVAGVRVATQGKRKIGDTLLERTDPRGEPYLWIGALREDSQPGEGTDLAAIAAGYVSVTPVHLDMTHGPSLDELRHRFPLTARQLCRFLAQLWRQGDGTGVSSRRHLACSGPERPAIVDQLEKRSRSAEGAWILWRDPCAAGLAGCTTYQPVAWNGRGSWAEAPTARGRVRGRRRRGGSAQGALR